MMRIASCMLMLIGLTNFSFARGQQSRVLDAGMHHLRAAGPREWTEFPEHADGVKLEVRFESQVSNIDDWTLELHQQDVKQDWNVLFGELPIGKLVRDENAMRIYLRVPKASIVVGENRLRIEQPGKSAPPVDDIRVGSIVLHSRSVEQVLSEATIEVEVTDTDLGRALPCRLTIIDRHGALQSVWPHEPDRLAVRPGVIYTADGRARLGLPAGEYTIHAGRGFEYSLAIRPQLAVAAGARIVVPLSIRREVPTDGYVACDTHIHTLTHSGHGDATVDERMLTLAGEGIELPIATDHNVQVDHHPFALKMGVRQYFTPVVGNELTTRVGHFNLFPVTAGGPLPDARLTDWKSIFDEVQRVTGCRAIVLNHPRDLHSGTRPFGPTLHNAIVGENLEGWELQATAMEVVNSGATQTRPLQLLHDWMGMLNRGKFLTPVGSSDSHDVARHFVGQGRTYIRVDDREPGNIDITTAVQRFVAGEVMVSYGLLAEVTVNGRYRSGEIAHAAEEYRIGVRVLGPHWVRADQVELFANGEPIARWRVPEDGDSALPRGVKWQVEHRMKKPGHDLYLTAIATGPGIAGLYWRTAKPYQPISADWTPLVLGCSGAVWLDADGDGRRSAAHDYAKRECDAAMDDFKKLLDRLAGYDRAVAAQAAQRLQSAGISLLAEESQAKWSQAAPAVQAGFRAYLDAWRENQLHRAAAR